MNWSKTGKKYSIESSNGGTVFNLDGLVVKQPVMSQEEAVKFLELNGFKGFEVDVPKVVKKKASKISNSREQAPSLKESDPQQDWGSAETT